MKCIFIYFGGKRLGLEILISCSRDSSLIRLSDMQQSRHVLILEMSSNHQPKTENSGATTDTAVNIQHEMDNLDDETV